MSGFIRGIGLPMIQRLVGGPFARTGRTRCSEGFLMRLGKAEKYEAKLKKAADPQTDIKQLGQYLNDPSSAIKQAAAWQITKRDLLPPQMGLLAQIYWAPNMPEDIRHEAYWKIELNERNWNIYMYRHGGMRDKDSRRFVNYVNDMRERDLGDMN